MNFDRCARVASVKNLTRSIAGRAVLGLGVLALALSAAAAQPAPAPPPVPPAPPARPVAAQGDEHGVAGELQKVALFAYLTQGYGISDGGQFLGIPKGGTTDYRTMALQIRYTASEEDALVVQLTSDRLGQSPIQAFKPDVEVQWAFYQRTLDADSKVRVGRFPIPLGIFNETNHVGTVLPLYRAPFDVYGEGTLASDVCDGLSASRHVALGKSFSLDAQAYYGSWDLLLVTPVQAKKSKEKSTTGIQLWLNTPLEGLRVGAAGFTGHIEGGISANLRRNQEPINVWLASLDGDFERFALRGEYKRSNVRTGAFNAYYGQATWKITSQLHLHFQKEAADIDFVGTPQVKYDRDTAAGLSYFVNSHLAIKAEGHDNQGLRAESPVTGRPVKSRYAILSLSTVF